MISLFSLQFKLRLLVTVVILIAIIGSVPSINKAVIKRIRTDETARYSSFNIRKQSFPIAFSVIKEKPLFGGGPFNASRYKEEYAIDRRLKEIGSFENSYLDFLVDLGLIGSSILLFIFLAIAKIIGFSSWQHKRTNIYRLGALASFVILIINMGTFSLNVSRLFHFIVWFYIGLNIALTNSSFREAK